MKSFIRKLVICACSIILGISSILFYNMCKAIHYDLNYTFTKVYGCIPVLIVYDTKNIFLYTDNVEEPLAGSFGPIVVLNKANYDKDLLLHELTHIRQFYSYGLAVQTLAYQLSQEFRVLFEYEAYSAEETKLSTAEFVDYMHKYYNISLTDEEILRIIKVLN